MTSPLFILLQVGQWHHHCSYCYRWHSDITTVHTVPGGEMMSPLFILLQVVQWHHHCSYCYRRWNDVTTVYTVTGGAVTSPLFILLQVVQWLHHCSCCYRWCSDITTVHTVTGGAVHWAWASSGPAGEVSGNGLQDHAEVLERWRQQQTYLQAAERTLWGRPTVCGCAGLCQAEVMMLGAWGRAETMGKSVWMCRNTGGWRLALGVGGRVKNAQWVANMQNRNVVIDYKFM